MAITGKEDISIARKEVKESQVGSVQTTKTLIFKHQASAGDLVINTTLLTAPAEALANGFIQDNPASVNLLVNKKNLRIHSSRGVELQMHEDFKVTGANTIQLIGNIEALGGALEGEVFTITVVPVQANAVLTTDHKKQYQEYLLAPGQTVLPLGREYEVNRNPLSQIGSIRVFRNGVGPLLRNVANAAASSFADGNYQEIDVGNGIGTTIEFNVAPSGQSDVIIVEFGLEYAGDFSLVGDMQSMWGSILKLADDVKDLGPYPISRYLTANPSEIERRAFGDMLLKVLEQEITLSQEYSAMGNSSFSANNLYIPVLGTVRHSRGANLGTINNTAADGWSFTANRECTAQISFSFGSNSGGGFSLNATASEMDNPVFNLAGTAKLYGYTSLNASGLNVGVAMVPMVAGDVLRIHSQDIITSPNVNMGMVVTARASLKSLIGL